MSATQIVKAPDTSARRSPCAADFNASDDSTWHLYRGIRNMLRCDEAEVVEGIAGYVIAQYAGLRLLSTLIEKTRNSVVPGIVAMIGYLRAYFSVRSAGDRAGAAWIARLSNERKALEPLLSLAPDLKWQELRFGSSPKAEAFTALSQHLRPRRIFRLVRRLHRRYEFFKVLRVVEFIGYYKRYLEIFAGGDFKLALMSSHSNPHGVAFNLAARKMGIPVVLVSHGMPIRPVARLSFDLAIVHCESAKQTYIDDGCRISQVLIHGRRQDYVPMPSSRLPDQMTVGIFLCKDVNEECLRLLLSDVLDRAGVARVLIRPHPKNLWRGLEQWIASLNNSSVDLTRSSRVLDDIKKADIVLGGNSSVLVDAVTCGRPAGFVANLDHGPSDLHQFVARGLIYCLTDVSGNLKWEPEAMESFYQRPEWLETLKFFANIEEEEEQVLTRCAKIMETQLARGTSCSFV